MENILEAKKLIESSEKIVLSAHANPDGDAIGSVFALYLSIKKLGKEPIVLLEDFNKRFFVIPSSDKVFTGDISLLAPDLFIALDCGEKSRLLDIHSEIFDRSKNTINIDHHQSNDNFATVNIVDVNKTSASEVVYDLIIQLSELNKDIMGAIYAGIVYDSAGFRHNKVSANTHKIAATAHELGVDFNKIYNTILGSHTLTEVSAFAKALENIKTDADDKIIYTYLTQDEILSSNSSNKELGSIVSYLLNTEGFDLAIFIYEKKEGINKVSLRSNNLDVNYLASFYGGGGHKLASGCQMEGNIFDNLEEIILKAKELIRDEKSV